MTRREARKSLGSRVARRSGTKTKVIPGGSAKRPQKSRFVHRRKTRLAVLVARKLKAAHAA